MPPREPLLRSIPAWAGEPRSLPSLILFYTVYPRVGGGTPNSDVVESLVDGLSPRGRGNHGGNVLPAIGGGSIPAWAGEPLGWALTGIITSVYPRVGGGTPMELHGRTGQCGLSPRGRGNR